MIPGRETAPTPMHQLRMLKTATVQGEEKRAGEIVTVCMFEAIKLLSRGLAEKIE